MRCIACNRYMDVRYKENDDLEDLCPKCLRIATQVLNEMFVPSPEYSQMNNLDSVTLVTSGIDRVTTKYSEGEWDNPDGFHREHTGSASKLFDKIKD